jgi:single-stranded DNA-binding protein
VWDPFATNLIEAGASKGDTVFVSGKIRERQFEKDGEKRSSVEISVGDQDDSIGLSSRWPRRSKSMDNAQANIASAKAALGATDDWGQDVAPF